MHNIDIKEVVEIVREAGAIAMSFYGRDYTIEEKDNKSPVTDADKAVDAFLCEKLKKYTYPILSEEGVDDKSRLDAEYVWIIDPLDGTSDFIQKTGEFTIMVGLVTQQESVLGVVYAPATDELYWAQKNKGAYSVTDGDTKEISVSDRDVDAMRILVSRNHLGQYEQDVAQKYAMEKIGMGSAGYKMCKIASGEAELYMNSSDKSAQWDTCAADVILREAGGSFCTMNGEKVLYNNDDVYLRDGYIAIHDDKFIDLVKRT